MLFSVALASVARVLRSVLGVCSGGVRVVSSLFVVAGFVVLGSLRVVFGGFGVVRSRVLVAICCFLRHCRKRLRWDVCAFYASHYQVVT